MIVLIVLWSRENSLKTRGSTPPDNFFDYSPLSYIYFNDLSNQIKNLGVMQNILCRFCTKSQVNAFFFGFSLGGTYMTLLNTIANLGSMWPTPMVLSLIEWFTTHRCDRLPLKLVNDAPYNCAECEELGGVCVETVRIPLLFLTL